MKAFENNYVVVFLLAAQEIQLVLGMCEIPNSHSTQVERTCAVYFSLFVCLFFVQLHC